MAQLISLRLALGGTSGPHRDFNLDHRSINLFILFSTYPTSNCPCSDNGGAVVCIFAPCLLVVVEHRCLLPVSYLLVHGTDPMPYTLNLIAHNSEKETFPSLSDMSRQGASNPQSRQPTHSITSALDPIILCHTRRGFQGARGADEQVRRTQLSSGVTLNGVGLIHQLEAVNTSQKGQIATVEAFVGGAAG